MSLKTNVRFLTEEAGDALVGTLCGVAIDLRIILLLSHSLVQPAKSESE